MAVIRRPTLDKPHPNKWTYFHWTVTIYSALFPLWFLLTVLYEDQIWPVWLLNAASKYLFWPAPVLLVVCLLRRRPRLTACLVAPLAMFLFLYGHLLLPVPAVAPRAPSFPFTVATYNVLVGNRDFEALAATILAQDADIVAVQELVAANARPLNDLLSDRFPFHTPLPTEHRLDVGIFSRYPVLHAERIGLPWMDLSWKATLLVNGASVQVLAVHLVPTLLGQASLTQWPTLIREREGLRMEQIDRILDSLSFGPTLMLCDCNFTETSTAYERVASTLRDAFADAGWGLGHTIHPIDLDLPLQRIDYVWHSAHFEALSARVPHGGTSDHYPVVVDLVLHSQSHDE